MDLMRKLKIAKESEEGRLSRLRRTVADNALDVTRAEESLAEIGRDIATLEARTDPWAAFDVLCRYSPDKPERVY